MAQSTSKFRMGLLVCGSVAVALAATLALSRDGGAREAGDRVLPDVVSESGGRVARFASRPYRLERIYKSMQGPMSVQEGLPIGAGAAETGGVAWVTGVRTTVVDAGTLKPIEQDFFCHSNLEASPDPAAAGARERLFGVDRAAMDSRLFTLVPGRLEIRLPEGFAVPVMPGEGIFYQSMVLNLNIPDIDRHVRLLTEVELAPPEAAGTLTPLYRRALYTLQEMAPGTSSAMTPEQAEQCGCGPGQSVSASASGVLRRFGQDKTLHWYVPPGRHEYVQDVTDQLALAEDASIHYATIHLHPTGRWAELRDVTAGETVLRLETRDHADRRGVAHVDEVSASEGIRLRAGHRYELVTLYENPGEKPVDAMSILYLYVAGQESSGPRDEPEMADTRLGGA